jgi:hypothetical protein
MCMHNVCVFMSTTVRLDEAVRDKLQQFKNEHGMTYNGAILRLLELAEMAPQEEQTKTEQPPSTPTTDTNREHVSLPDPQEFFREGFSGASDFVTQIVQAQMTGSEYGPTTNSIVWELYKEMDGEPRLTNRTGDPTPPTLDDLITFVEDIVDNPSKYTEPGFDEEFMAEYSKRILRALVTYRKITEVRKIPLESERMPNLSVPKDRTYRGEQQDGDSSVTADGEELAPRPDLGGRGSFSWGYGGTGPHNLAIAILADAYPDRYARARNSELVGNFISPLSTGKSWEIQAGELEQYINGE